jgi:fumarylacetoacetase
MSALDWTHDPALRSWVESANAAGSDFPIQNLPLGVFRSRTARPTIGVAIGDQILDLRACIEARDLHGPEACRGETLNALMALPAGERRALRLAIAALLRADARRLEWLVPQSAVEMDVPARIGDYTDFYASVHHATRVGRRLRPESPLFPNYKWLPVAYHGRASSIVVSGTPVRRPSGQTHADGAPAPLFGPSRRLDYEAEIGFFLGPGGPLGASIPVGSADAHIVGACLVNDWSARDLQKWEYQPLGPFLAKSFATTISPWVVTMEALLPFRAPLSPRGPDDPAPLPYLAGAPDGGLGITVEVYLETPAMRDRGMPPVRVSTASFLDMYWTPAQMVTHHASNGCNLRPGDLLASGTVSGPAEESAGCLLERASAGEEPIALPSGERRAFLEDGDTVVMRAFCAREGFTRIGFGECRGSVVGP